MNTGYIKQKLFSYQTWKKCFNLLVVKLKKCFSFDIWVNTSKLLSDNYILAYWWRGSNNKNWGDKINPWIIQELSGKQVLHTDEVINLPLFKVQVCSGSVLQQIRFSRAQIWGSGFISSKSKFDLRLKLSDIYSVRGPSTQKKLRLEGISAPNVYGDPAIVLPYIYTPNVEKEFSIGLIPHYSDKKNDNVKRLKKAGAHIIDIFSGEKEVIDMVNRCECILSSSLHGLIVADVYGVKSKWVKFGENLYGDDFKFGDYYKSIGLKNEQPFFIDHDTSLLSLKEACWGKNIPLRTKKLLDVCPFYHEDVLS